LPSRILLNPRRDQPEQDRVGPDQIASSAVTRAELQDLGLAEPDRIQHPRRSCGQSRRYSRTGSPGWAACARLTSWTSGSGVVSTQRPSLHFSQGIPREKGPQRKVAPNSFCRSSTRLPSGSQCEMSLERNILGSLFDSLPRPIRATEAVNVILCNAQNADERDFFGPHGSRHLKEGITAWQRTGGRYVGRWNPAM
jgi:hypothetical protein